jgi:hypothetical protein
MAANSIILFNMCLIYSYVSYLNLICSCFAAMQKKGCYVYTEHVASESYLLLESAGIENWYFLFPGGKY